MKAQALVIALLLPSAISHQQHQLRGQTKYKGAKGVRRLAMGDMSLNGKMGQKSISIANLDLFSNATTTSIASSSVGNSSGKMGKNHGMGMGMLGSGGKSITVTSKGIIITNGGSSSTNVGARQIHS